LIEKLTPRGISTMTLKARILQVATFALLGSTVLQVSAAHAESTGPSVALPPISVNLDGHPLGFAVPPVIENGNTLVQMRPIFEAQGAKVTWDNQNRTFTATKNGDVLTYRIGDTVAYKNANALNVPYPGKIMNGSTMVPLRFVSETLGNVVQWHDYDSSITISSTHSFETSVERGVNLRVSPDKTNARVIRMLSKGEQVHVIREIGDWLEVQTKDDNIGFMSAKPIYSTYTSAALADRQGDEILAFGSKFLGTPYEFGAKAGKIGTFDCSSFVWYVYNQVLGLDFSRASYDQAKEGKDVSFNELRKGDLLFFSARGIEIGHVAIYAGNGRVLHTYSTASGGVHFMDLDDKWKKRFVKAKRMF
jgi:cell wall-associated NlpC family hydrolase